MAIGAASAQSSQSDAATGAVPWPASASVAHLKVNGTAMVASLAASSSTIAANHPQLQIAAVGRPDIGPQMDNGREQRTAIGGDACGSGGRVDGGGRSFRVRKDGPQGAVNASI